MRLVGGIAVPSKAEPLIGYIMWPAAVSTVPLVLFGTGPVDYLLVGSVAFFALFGWLATLKVTTVLHDRRARVFTPPTPTIRSTPAKITVVLLLQAVTATILFRTVDRGVTWPWQPTARQIEPACAALETAKLTMLWNPETRLLERDDMDENHRGARSSCSWVRGGRHAYRAPFPQLTASNTRHQSHGFLSGIGVASTYFLGERSAAVDPRTLSGVGDDAFVSTTGETVTATGRRANVTVTVTVRFDKHPNEYVSLYGVPRQHAEMTAQLLVSVVLRNVQLHSFPG